MQLLIRFHYNAHSISFQHSKQDVFTKSNISKQEKSKGKIVEVFFKKLFQTKSLPSKVLSLYYRDINDGCWWSGNVCWYFPGPSSTLSCIFSLSQNSSILDGFLVCFNLNILLKKMGDNHLIHALPNFLRVFLLEENLS